MQKDVHFYMTFALAIRAGIDMHEAAQIAWADQFTDDCTSAKIHGIQTQADLIGNWGDKQIQHSVIMPFHFVPGVDSWIVTPGSIRVQELVKSAINDEDVFSLGIALHALQDSFSHQNFTGWNEKHNACYPWYYIQSPIPNIGHAELRVIPDVVNYVWTDPRTGDVIDNKERALTCASLTYFFLMQFNHAQRVHGPQITEQLTEIFKIKSYDERKEKLRLLSGFDISDYKLISGDMQKKGMGRFIAAARRHLSRVMKSVENLEPPKAD